MNEHNSYYSHELIQKAYELIELAEEEKKRFNQEIEALMATDTPDGHIIIYGKRAVDLHHLGSLLEAMYKDCLTLINTDALMIKDKIMAAKK